MVQETRYSGKSNKNFLLTINESVLEDYQKIVTYLTAKPNFQYLLCCEHHGNENKHYHLFVQFTKTTYLSYKHLYGAHLDECRGSAQQNIEYCWARDRKHKELGVTATLIDEIGEPKYKGGDWSVKTIRELDSPDELPALHYNVYKKIKRDTTVTKAKDFRKHVKVYWIQGPSGVGKSNKAIDLASEWEETLECGTDFVKFVNGFYLGCTPTAKVAIYDDFRDSHMSASEFINFIDYNKHWMNIKGDSILNNYNCIIITSVQKFERIFRNVDDEPRAQWERRIEVIDMFPPRLVCVGGLPVGETTEFNKFEDYQERLRNGKYTEENVSLDSCLSNE